MGPESTPHARPVQLFGALADPVRFELLRRLKERGSLNVGELATGLPVTRSAISQHLAVLRDAGLVRSARHGRNVRYTIAEVAPGPLGDWATRYRRFETDRNQATAQQRPGLRLASAAVAVRDQDRSLIFYRDALGFSVVNDHRAAGIRWLSLAPPQGTAVIVLQAASSTGDLPFRGSWTGLTFMSDDIHATFRDLAGRGVAFDGPPALQPWGGTVATFADIDGNRFGLVEMPPPPQPAEPGDPA